MQNPIRATVPALCLLVLLAGCGGLGAPAADLPAGYHRMPDGSVMADAVATDDTVDPAAGAHDGMHHDDHDDADLDRPSDGAATTMQALGASGVEVPVHRSAITGELTLGTAPAPGHEEHAGHSGHGSADPADFPTGIVPTRMRIERLGVDAPVEEAALSPQIGVSDDPAAVAWLADTRRPGQFGPALVGGRARLGGSDTVLSGLADLTPGDVVVVVDAAGEELAFTVEQVRSVPVSERTSTFLAGPGRSPELRVVAWESAPDGSDVVVTTVLAD